MKQLPATAAERKAWGRYIDGYPGAWGTGWEILDPSAEDVRLDGALWLMVKIDVERAKMLWIGCGISTDHPNSAYHLLEESDEIIVELLGYKVKKSLFSGSKWVTSISLLFDKGENQVPFGWLPGGTIVQAFEAFDRCLHQQLSVRHTVLDVL